MRRYRILTAVLAAITVPSALSAPAGAVAPTPAEHHAQLVAFHSVAAPGEALGAADSWAAGVSALTRFCVGVAPALVFAYILHPFFAHDGVSIVIWLIVIGLAVHLIRRGRRRRYVYRSSLPRARRP